MPNSWKEVSLEDLENSKVIKLGRGNVISKKDMASDPGPNPVYSSAENKNGMIGKYAKYMFDEELITWSVDGGGHIFYRPKHKFSVTNIGGWLRILNPQVFSYQFLTYALQRLHKQHHFDWQHKAHPSVIRKLYTRIPLPPLLEQKRIVDLISSVDSYIKALEQQLESARKSRSAVLHEMLSAGGEGWTETTLDGIADYLNGYPFKPAELGEDGVPVIRIKQLLDPMEPVDRTLAKVPEKNHLEDGDIIFSWSGTLAVRIWNRGKAYLNQHLFKVVEKKGVVRNFLPLAIEHAIDDLVAKSHGTTMKHITKQTLLPHKILLPPLAVQKRIVDFISSMDDGISATDKLISETEKLRSGLLSDLLSGEHEIPESYDKVMGVA
jgi:type I restriction enzyme S subunit